MLDVFLVPSDQMSMLRDLASDRTVSLASHHFPVTGIINAEPSLREPSFANEKYNFTMLKDPTLRACFADQVQRNMSELQG